MPARPARTKHHGKQEKRAADRNVLQQLQQQVDDFDLSTPVEEFKDLPLSKQTLTGLSSAYYTKLTDIQSKSLPLALKGKDVLGAARTGSGKTLAFLIPVLENLLRKKWGPNDGLGALVISPTRELAVQIFEVLRKIGHQHQFSAGLVIGGKNLKDEQDRLSRMNILVATPGRLLQHMDQTLGFECDHLQMLVLDEADRILDMGFSASLNAIIANLPRSRQTLLFSATQTKSVKDLARLSLQSPEYVAVRESGKGKEKAQDGEADEEEALEEVPKNLEQHYMLVDLPSKLDVLWTFIKTHLFTKTIVFLSSGKQVRFVYENFRHMRPGVPLLHMHGKQKQLQRLEIYQRFLSAKHSILFATDIAARGLDFPSIDWVVQVDCPEDVETYIHRVGRTARYQSKGKALLFLLPSEEEGFVKRLEAKKVDCGKIKANEKKRQTVRSQLQSAAFQYPEIKFLAQRAFISYVRSVYLQKDKQTFDVSALPLEEYAASLGLAGAPKIKFVSKQEASNKKNQVRQVEDLKKELQDKNDSADEDGSDDGSEESEGESEDDEEASADDDEEEETAKIPDGEEDDDPKSKGVKTKYDRMFNRKSQTILSDHYTKLIDHSDDEGDAKGKGGAQSLLVGGDDDDQDDFITIKRRDHDLNEAELPSSAYLSKRKLKQGQSKKAMMSQRGNPTKLVFDDEGDGHAIYELGDLDSFEKEGNAAEQQKKFVEAEKEKLKEADVKDKERQKELRREKKRKRKEIERGSDGESGDEGGGYEFEPTGEIIHPDFDDVELPSGSDDDLDRPTFHSAPTSNNGPNKKKQRRARFDDDDDENDYGREGQPERSAPKIDLEALALQALARK
ncbi:RNA-dependent ATPase HCA4 [Sporobolomyces koalae]|uniref:RNA-dependent ATPase HCA4 n=1 Tax=Sporobolomyces koalae TaxID=500713 RepID=UPI00316B4401